MSDIDDWLRAHEEEPVDVARETDLEAPLVHLAAVLVLVGFDDAWVYDQLHALVLSLDGQRHPLAGAARALEQIRHLATANP